MGPASLQTPSSLRLQALVHRLMSGPFHPAAPLPAPTQGLLVRACLLPPCTQCLCTVPENLCLCCHVTEEVWVWKESESSNPPASFSVLYLCLMVPNSVLNPEPQIGQWTLCGSRGTVRWPKGSGKAVTAVSSPHLALGTQAAPLAQRKTQYPFSRLLSAPLPHDHVGSMGAWGYSV